jgi:hypothetical protein
MSSSNASEKHPSLLLPARTAQARVVLPPPKAVPWHWIEKSSKWDANGLDVVELIDS